MSLRACSHWQSKRPRKAGPASESGPASDVRLVLKPAMMAADILNEVCKYLSPLRALRLRCCLCLTLQLSPPGAQLFTGQGAGHVLVCRAGLPDLARLQDWLANRLLTRMLDMATQYRCREIIGATLTLSRSPAGPRDARSRAAAATDRRPVP